MNMNSVWHNINPSRVKCDDFIAVIEIPKGCKNKYELDKESGALILDRILHTSTHYPANYGFIPLTFADDNDPLDVLVLCSEQIVPMAIVRCYPIGVMCMTDQGEMDYKIIAIPYKDPTWNHMNDITDLPPHIMQEITHFFHVYKELEHKDTVILEIMDRIRAEEIIESAIVFYKDTYL